MRQATMALVGFLLGFALAQSVNFPKPQGQLTKATVVKVIDGDTIDVSIGQNTFRVRIIGYDAPEKNQPFGETATKFLQALVEGREVLLESDAQAIDKYGRRLYHVWLPQVLLSELMLLSGLGQQMTIPPNVRHVDFLTKAQQSGRDIGLGIWAVPFPKTSSNFEPWRQSR